MFTAYSISIAHNTGVSNKIVRIEPSHKKEGKRGTAHQFNITQTTVALHKKQYRATRTH